MTNDDVADLYSRVNIGTRVVVKPMDRRARELRLWLHKPAAMRANADMTNR